MYNCSDQLTYDEHDPKEADVTTSQMMKNEREAGRMLQDALEAMKFSIDGRKAGDIFIFMQEVDIVLARFASKDLSEPGKCRVAIGAMKVPAKKTVRTHVSVGKIPNQRYTTFAEEVFDLYMASATVIETNIRIWNLGQKAGENATAWGARCLRAIMYRVKKDVADCSRHQ